MQKHFIKMERTVSIEYYSTYYVRVLWVPEGYVVLMDYTFVPYLSPSVLLHIVLW